MRIPPSLRRETVVVRRYLGSGAYGPVYDDPVTYAPPMRGVYVEPGFRRVTNAQGEEVVASATAFFDADADDIMPGSLVEWQGRTYKVIDAQPIRPFGRTNHVEVVLQSTDEGVES